MDEEERERRERIEREARSTRQLWLWFWVAVAVFAAVLWIRDSQSKEPPGNEVDVCMMPGAHGAEFC